MPQGTAGGARVFAGLCASCRHARCIESDRGSIFVLCGYAAVDPRFPKYPRLPMLACTAYAPASDGAPDTAPSQPVRGRS
jgi:hypothetical protein